MILLTAKKMTTSKMTTKIAIIVINPFWLLFFILIMLTNFWRMEREYPLDASSSFTQCKHLRELLVFEPVIRISVKRQKSGQRPTPSLLAEGEGFEPSKRVTPLTPFPRVRLQPLGHPSLAKVIIQIRSSISEEPALSI